MFARLGGGIFTKAADVGADLVGKVEAGIPEDDPRNPATIADNVGDNVGDCAGMAADLFETYAVTAVAVMLLGVLTFHESTRVALYPLVLGGVAIIASIIGTFAVRSTHGQRRARALPGPDPLGRDRRRGVRADHLLADARPDLQRGRQRREHARAWGKFYLCSLIGIAVTALLFVITDYYTSTRFSPVKKTAQRVDHGPRHEHHPGLRLGPAGDGAAGARARARHPRRVEARGGGVRHLRRRRGGHGPALADRPDRRARRVRPDHRQRRRDRRDGRPARGGAQRHRPARRGRQHDQGRHQGLRDRLGGARRGRAVRRLPPGTRGQQQRPRRSSSASTNRRC